MAEQELQQTEELEETQEWFEQIIYINRVAKVTKGGKTLSFSVLAVVGDQAGHAGFGIGKAHEVADAIRKAVEQAKKNVVEVPRRGTTIPHEIMGRFKAAKVFLRPAAPGTGVIAGGPVRAVMNAAGIQDILTKCLGSKNPINIVRATFRGFEEIKRITETAKLRKMRYETTRPKASTRKQEK